VCVSFAGLITPRGQSQVGADAAVTAPARVSVQHQKLLHFVGEGKWSDESVLAKVGELVIPAIERDGPRGLDYRRYVLSQAGHPFGRRAPSVLRAARQAGQLPGGGDAVGGQS
jgi:SRSO17 transposase